jgi:hypothetical protein
MPQERTERQLKLIEEFAALAADAEIECWLRGGWALDFLLRRVTRSHQDIDLFIWATDAQRLLDVLRRHGYREAGGPPPEQQRNLAKDGEEFHVTLLERGELGIVTAGGRWAESPWPDGMLDGPIGHIGNVRCRVISAGAQLWAKEEVPRALGHLQRQHDPGDIALLRQTLGRVRRLSPEAGTTPSWPAATKTARFRTRSSRIGRSSATTGRSTWVASGRSRLRSPPSRSA